jgi:hypothetical protein
MRSVQSARFGLIGLLAAVSAPAQWASDWSQVNLNADFLGPEALSEPNAVLVADHVWQAYAETTNQNGAVFTFVELDTGGVWGDLDQADVSIPLAGVAEQTDNAMVIAGVLPRYTRFRFNEQTRAYAVTDVTPPNQPNLWINEIDYDNPGTDTNEWIELAGAAGVSLNGYELALINQAGSTYAVVDLAAANFTFADETDGFGFFVLGIVQSVPGLAADYTPAGWTSDELQNGPGDSIQLRRKRGRIVHLVDYRGDNPATDEDQTAGADSAASAADSLYLAGLDGGNFDGFTWQNQTDRSTPGAVNSGQSLRPLLSPFAAVELTGLATVPAAPGSTDPVHLRVNALPQDGASNLTLTAFYRIGANGAFAPILMGAAGNTFSTTSPIPAQPTGTLVEYYLVAVFDGGGTNSPTMLGSPAAPMSYGIARHADGAVWINEINAEGLFSVDTNEFIELTGPVGGDISGWTLELFGASTTAYASYILPAGSLLGGDGSGYGFFVLGDSGVPGVDQPFTHTGGGMNQLANSGAIRLRNELGFDQYLLAYGQFAPTNLFPDAEYIGYEDFFSFDDEHLALAGTAAGYAGFAWDVEISGSPGQANLSQTLTGGNGNGDDPIVEILDILVAGNAVTILSTGTNTWNVAPEYTTDLGAGEAGWTPIAPATVSYNNGIHTITFPVPSPNPAAQLRIRQTRP